MAAPEICFLTATELMRLVNARELSALEVMEAHLSQIERVNPEVNAIVTLTAERSWVCVDLYSAESWVESCRRRIRNFTNRSRASSVRSQSLLPVNERLI